MLAVDAMAGAPPAVWAVLTTSSTDPSPARYRRSIDLLRRAMKRRWPELADAVFVEFTTGYGPLAGGERRPHWNLLLKGVPVEDLVELEELIKRVWCRREAAVPEAQHVGSIYAEGGLMKYLALHFQKESQKPPHGWRGHRFTASRGYFVLGRDETRRRAQEQLRTKRAVWKFEQAAEAAGVELIPGEAWEWAERTRELERVTRWRLVELTEELLPTMRTPGKRAVRRARAAS